MKKHRMTALFLAALMVTAPVLAACDSAADKVLESPVLPEDEPLLPETPDAPETPALPEELPENTPETPDTPQSPALPEAPDTPDADEDGETDEQPDDEIDIPVVSLQAQYVRSLTNGLNIRSGAGTGYASLGQVNAGDMLHFVRREGGWYETRYRGKTAYVSAETAYTSMTFLDKASDGIEAIITEGLDLLGVPYVYGATRLHDGKGNFLKGFSKNAFDCSSLMQYIFYTGAGILLDVTTRTQVKQGVPVTWRNIERGDLLFFTNAQRYNKPSVERIGHVALYLGENYILHTASDYAVIEQMSATRQKYFITGRRVL